MKVPGPDHPITITRHQGRVTVRRDSTVIAESENALAMQEASYPVAFYIPRADANMALLERTGHATYCPYKGGASYFSFRSGEQAENAVWTYERPYPAVAEIKDHLAFYPDRVEISVE